MKRVAFVLVALFLLAGTANASLYDDPTSAYGKWTGDISYSAMFGMISGTETGTFTINDSPGLSFFPPYALYVPSAFPPDSWSLSDNTYLTDIQGSVTAPNTLTYTAKFSGSIEYEGTVINLDNASILATLLFYYDANGNTNSMFASGSVTNPTGFTIATASGTFSKTPIPGAIWLLGSGLVGLFGMRRRFLAA